MKNRPEISLTFVSSAYNEADNLEELYSRCRAVHASLQEELRSAFTKLLFRFVIADNRSSDKSLAILKELCKKDPAVIVIANSSNYGAEISGVNALKHAIHDDFIVLLCSDLQDPPEMAIGMVKKLLEQQELDAVLAIKSQTAESTPMRLARWCYYKVLSYSTRKNVVPSGFHGFGCYRRDVINYAIDEWEHSALSMRQCLVNACQDPNLVEYVQAERKSGVSSYRGWGYWPEGIRNVISGDAAASRLALAIGSIGLLLALLIGFLLIINFVSGRSGYSSGVPTVMGIVLISFALQMLMFSIISRQVESMKSRGIRPRVRFRLLADSSTQKNCSDLNVD